jgi:hypothetical protein
LGCAGCRGDQPPGFELRCEWERLRPLQGLVATAHAAAQPHRIDRRHLGGVGLPGRSDLSTRLTGGPRRSANWLIWQDGTIPARTNAVREFLVATTERMSGRSDR